MPKTQGTTPTRVETHMYYSIQSFMSNIETGQSCSRDNTILHV
jgi:hypothetical protein